MKKRNDLRSFAEALWDEPINKPLAVLDIIGFMGAVAIVIDDPSEAIDALTFLAVLLVENYLIFVKQQTRIAERQHALDDAAPDIVPLPIETTLAHGKPFRLHLRNEVTKSTKVFNSLRVREDCDETG